MPEPITDIEIESKPIQEYSDTAYDVLSIYRDKLHLTEEQKKEIVKGIKAELKEIRREREKMNLDKKFDALDNQYDGKCIPDDMRMFNLVQNITKEKVDFIAMTIKESFFDVDPMFAIFPRPEYGKGIGQEVCLKQQDFLDYKMDNLPFDQELDLVAHSAVLKGIGWLEIYYDIVRESKRREEYYEAKLIPVLDDEGRPIMQDGLPIWENKGLVNFLQNWPNAVEDYPELVRKLAAGKDITFIATYKETVYNDPRPKYHDPKNVFARVSTQGYEGLKTTRLIAIKENYTYWDLKREEKAEKFYDIDKLVSDSKDPSKKIEGYENKDFDILKCIYYYDLTGNGDEIKIVVHLHEDKNLIICSYVYPLYTVACNIIPFYIKRKKQGLYQPGLGEDMTDSNIAENEILNVALEGAVIRNTVTPITDSKAVQDQFYEKRFTHGVPIEARPGEIDFLQKYMSAIDINGLISLNQYMKLGDDKATRVSSGMSGAETPFDPNAPATKTIALLRQSGRGVADYLRHFLPSFNEIGYVMLGCYYQMSKDGRDYMPNAERIVGDNPFATITREEMAARTNIQAMAFSYEMDKVNEKALDLGLYQIVRQEPLVANNPEAVYTLLKNLVEGWSKKWKNTSNRILPSLSELKQKQIIAAANGVQAYANALKQQSIATGQQPDIDPNALLQAVGQAMSQLVNPQEQDAAQPV